VVFGDKLSLKAVRIVEMRQRKRFSFSLKIIDY